MKSIIIKSAAAILLPFLVSGFAYAQQKEPWVSLPKDQWPQIALTNNVQFKNGDRYIDPSFVYAGTGFLIDNETDTLAATAKHILWIAKNRKSKAVVLNEDLKEWTMTPKGNPQDVIVVDRLINEDSSEILEGSESSILERDWIVFSLKQSSEEITPLKPRWGLVQPGEKVYIISAAYKDPVAKVYEGKVLKQQGMDILLERNAGEHLPGSSGAPVVDANGYLIGIISSSSTDGKSGKAVSVVSSTEYLKEILDHKPGLNEAKKDYGPVILETVLSKGVKAAVTQYKQLAADPKNYYRYTLRSANRNGLRETGEKLIEMKRYADAIEILELNIREYGGYFQNYNSLAKAFLLNGDMKSAKKNYQLSAKQLPDPEENEAFDALKKL